MPEPGATGSGTSGGMGAGEQDVAGDLDLSRDDDAVERNVEDEEGGKEGTTTSFTKDTTAAQSISNYDNFSDMDFSFERSRVASRDANSAIGDYVARVAGISIDRIADQRRAASEETNTAMALERHNARLESRESALAAARMDRTQFSDSSTYADDWMARMDAEREAERAAAKIDATTPSLVDDWGMTQFGWRSRLGRKGALTDSDLNQLTQRGKTAKDLADASRRAAVKTGNEFADYENQIALTESRRQAQIDQQNAEARAIAIGPDFGLRDANVQVQINNAAIKEAEAVLESEDATVEQKVEAATKKNAAISDKNRLMMQQRRNRARQEYNAVTDPTASVYSKDVHTRVGLEKLQDYIASVANRPLFNTGLTYTKHDPATTMKVQKAIERYDDVYGSWLNNMGKRNSEAINAKGFDMSKGLGIMGSNVIQGIMNKLGWAYHATDTEKQLRAIKSRWGLGEDEPEGGLPIDEQKARCDAKVGWKWDEETNTCKKITDSDFNKRYRDFLPT